MYRTLPYSRTFRGGGAAAGFPVRQPDRSASTSIRSYTSSSSPCCRCETPPAAVARRRTGAGRHDGLRHGRRRDQHHRHAADRLPAPDAGRDALRPRRTSAKGGVPSSARLGRANSHRLPRGADARAPRRILFAGGPFVDSSCRTRCCASSSVRRCRWASSGSSPASSPPKFPCAYERLRGIRADAHPAGRRAVGLRADRRTAGLHPAVRLALRRPGAAPTCCATWCSTRRAARSSTATANIWSRAASATT